MATVTSPPLLQGLSTTAASIWLLDWAGQVGRCAATSATIGTPGDTTADPLLTTTNPTGNTNSEAINSGFQKCSQVNNPCFVGSSLSLTEPRSIKNGSSHGSASLSSLPASTSMSSSFLEQLSKKSSSKRLNTLKKRVSIKTEHDENAKCQKVPYDSQNMPSPAIINSECSELSVKPNGNHHNAYFKFPEELDETFLKFKVTQCTEYLQSLLPPLLLEGVVREAWARVNLQVTGGEQGKECTDFQVIDWVRTAPVLITLSAHVSDRKFSLNVSGMPQDCLTRTLRLIGKCFPLGRVNKLYLPRKKYKCNKQFMPMNSCILRQIIEKASLVSLTLGSNLSCDNSLGLISDISLQELNIELSANSTSEEIVVKELCSLPLCSADEVKKAIRTGDMWNFKMSALRCSLRKLVIYIVNMPSSLYQVLPLIFSNLQYYHPSANLSNCICEAARLLHQSECENMPSIPQPLTQLESVDLGHTSISEMYQVNVACPFVKEISLNTELYVEETFQTIALFKHIAELDLAYYPSSPTSQPKQDGRLLLPLLSCLKHQLLSLSLTGFNLMDIVVNTLSLLPELKTLQLADSWISTPKVMPGQPFRSLENLTLKLLPSDNMMHLLTAGTGLVNLVIDIVASEWEGNALTDGYVAHLVTSGRITTLQTFSAKSPLLTLASLKTLSLLPFLKSVGHLALWGLTEDELRCVTHSGPPHILCIL